MISDLVERREVKQKCLQVESTKQQLTSLPPRKIWELEGVVVIVRVMKTGIAQKCVQVTTRPPGYLHSPWSDDLSTSIQAGDDALGKMESDRTGLGGYKDWRGGGPCRKHGRSSGIEAEPLASPPEDSRRQMVTAESCKPAHCSHSWL